MGLPETLLRINAFSETAHLLCGGYPGPRIESRRCRRRDLRRASTRFGSIRWILIVRLYFDRSSRDLLTSTAVQPGHEHLVGGSSLERKAP